jgi:hypothetical protein
MIVLTLVLAGAATVGVQSQVPASEPPYWPCESNDGAPFGHLSDADIDTLISFAKANGLDLPSTVEKLYAGDQAALGTVLRLSMKLTVRDIPMRVYGNMVYSVFLNLGEKPAHPIFIPVLNAQESAVRQRIRDFLWYPIYCVPSTEREKAAHEAKADLGVLWPPEWVFGQNDALFTKTPNDAVDPPHSTVTPLANGRKRRAGGRGRYRLR